MKYNRSGTNLQGNINTIVRNAGRVYQIKGNSMTSLAVQPTTAGGAATFNGKASIQDITNPLAPLSVDGNATLQVKMTDLGEPGSADSIAITVWNKTGGLWFASNWIGTQTVQQVLAGGNIRVRGGAVGPASAAASAAQGSEGIASSATLPLAYALGQNAPNPFGRSTVIHFDLPERSRVMLVVYDVSGRLVATLVDGDWEPGNHSVTWSGETNGQSRVDAGVYFVRMTANSVTTKRRFSSLRKMIVVE